MGEAVILGMPGPWADDNYEAADHYTTKIGGVPDWPCIESVIQPELLRCDSCRENLCLVAQIYAPISSKILTVEERMIYILACITPSCETNGWRALRLQKLSDNKGSEPASHDSSASPLTTKPRDDLWSFDFDDEDDEFDLEELGKALTEATTLASASKTKKPSTCPDTIENCSPVSLKSRTVDNKTTVLPCFYIYTQEENYSKNVASLSTSISSLNIKENQSDGNEQAPEEAWEGESYEYDKALNADRTYLKFKKRLDLHPEQCFRYSYGGKPLLATTEAGDPGRCELCGESRHYEMQLMPPLLYYLQEATKDNSLENWNWMSLIVYTCSKGCAPASKQESDGWVVAKEAIVVQTE
ncbi:Programmed cell death protein 2, C-terminal [Artemisia annua]|uniref:Programmed cell death protein 2, C-terminal n=1 Tax=Artemisia annua TaxID=35608 RepID=A0A2U1MWY9_ARTAN|nr:Programmed cell death protein 2, C-terminal [Artemisia annua]